MGAGLAVHDIKFSAIMGILPAASTSGHDIHMMMKEIERA